MLVTLPRITRSFNEATGLVETQEDVIKAQVDTSFRAHLKWEENFQAFKGLTLTEMTAVVADIIKDRSKAVSKITDILRVLYCYLQSDELPTFNDFLGLLDLENTQVIIQKITTVLEGVGNTAAKN
jgi:hypothetical protein